MKWNIRDLTVYEDKELIVIRKPGGLAVETRKVYEPDLFSLLRAEYPEIYLVHRLDQGVEGLMAAAKTGKAAAELSRQLQDGRMKKRYLAKVCGRIPREEDTLVDYLVKDGRTNTTRVLSEEEIKGLSEKKASAAPRSKASGASSAPQKAVLTYRKCGDDIVQVDLLTGRHHQIRAQLSHAGMPILGDGKYGGDPWPGLCLCASELVFRRPGSGREMVFTTKPTSF